MITVFILVEFAIAVWSYYDDSAKCGADSADRVKQEQDGGGATCHRRGARQGTPSADNGRQGPPGAATKDGRAKRSKPKQAEQRKVT